MEDQIGIKLTFLQLPIDILKMQEILKWTRCVFNEIKMVIFIEIVVN